MGNSEQDSSSRMLREVNAMETRRLFMALPLPHSAKTELERVRAVLQEELPQSIEYTWEPTDNYHISMRFLGNVTTEDYEGIIKASQDIALPGNAKTNLTLWLDGFGMFPTWEQPSVLWAGVGGEISHLTRIQRYMEHVVHQAGFSKSEYEFTPHITLARMKNVLPEHTKWLLGVAQRQNIMNPVKWQVDSIHLMESMRVEYAAPGMNRAIYVPVSSGPLGTIPGQPRIS